MIEEGLGTWLPRRRLRSPDDLAIVCGEERLTYRQFADRADVVADMLASKQVTTGDRVAYMGENSVDFLCALFGVVALGAVFVPVNTRLAAREIAHVVDDSGARMLIHDGRIGDRLEHLIDNCRLEAVIETGDGSGALGALMAAAPPRGEVTAASGADAAAIIYTSGTTGRAKGATLTHANLTAVAINTIIDYDVLSTDVALMISPLFHVASLGMGALPVILKGGALVVEPGFEAGRALELIERHRVTMLSGVPTTFQMMADHPTWASTDLSSLSKLTCGGSPAPVRIIDAFEQRGLHFSQGYGMTEAAPGVTALSPAMTREKRGSVGLPHFFTQVRIRSKGEAVPPGVVGAIEITGPNVFAGYHNMPEATSDAFTKDGWFHTGDLGYVDDDGYLFISGRKKDMIISGGENIYPVEVEALLGEMSGVSGAAVVGMPDERWGEVPWAVLSLQGGASISEGDVLAWLDGKLARYKIPKRVEFVDQLPRTASGKIRKMDVRKQLEER